MDVPRTIGVAGAGTMGGGIAQLACLCGSRTLLYDPDGSARLRAIDAIERRLQREVARARVTQAAAEQARSRLEAVTELRELADCELVIEAAPESLQIKRGLLGELADQVVGSDCVLATNTSSLLVTEIAAGVAGPERVVGMHFFNPPPVMAGLELVAGVASSERALALARVTGEAMGKVVIDAVDGPGFLVNRCNRPFTLEALGLLTERLADVEQIDRVCRLGGGFRMGPFELIDLVGVDVNLAVARSMFEQSFGEPRWRPSPLAVRMVAAGRLGRKTGRGFYEYPTAGHADPGGAPAHRSADPEAPPTGGGADRVVVIAGSSSVALELRVLAAEAGWTVAGSDEASSSLQPFLVLDARAPGEELRDPRAADGPRAIWCAAGSLGLLDDERTAIGFMALPPLREAKLVELTGTPATAGTAARACEDFFETLGLLSAWVDDAPGLVLGRIVCQLVNEAAFALGEGVGGPADIDGGVVHALNYPRGILRWADEIGLDVVLAVLDALHDERGDPRYRPAPALTRLVRSGRLGRQADEGFFEWGGGRSGDGGPANSGC
jgi:3-hydroxybutyryl-CoA dehydrogenase